MARPPKLRPMNAQAEMPVTRYETDTAALYSIDVAAHLAQVPRHLILVACKHRLIAPQPDPGNGAYYFDAETLRTLRRIGYLHQQCGVNMTGIRIILGLMDEVSRLRTAD